MSSMMKNMKNKLIDKILYNRHKKKENAAVVKKIMNLPIDVYEPNEEINRLIQEKKQGD